LLPQKPKIGQIGQPPKSKVYGMTAHRKRHARDAPFVEYHRACRRRSACVDIGQTPFTRLLKHRSPDCAITPYTGCQLLHLRIFRFSDFPNTMDSAGKHVLLWY